MMIGASPEPIESLDDLRSSISELLAYCYEDEQHDYENQGRQGDTGPHIFTTIQRLSMWVGYE